MSDPNHFTIEKHPSTTNPNISVISITGIDVTELGNGYSPNDLRVMSQRLQNIAANFEYSNNAASTNPLIEMPC